MNYATYKKKIEERNKNLISRLQEPAVARTIKFDEYELSVHPGVFDPSLGEGSIIMARNKHLFAGENVLEIGTGSGALAILAAEKSKKVIATDISEKAIQCAKENISKYNLDNIIELRQGNLFSVLGQTERFDIILFNPPFLNGEVTSVLSHSYNDTDYSVLNSFIANSKLFLKENGVIYLCFGGVGDMGYLNTLIRNENYVFQIIESMNFNEINFFIYKIKRHG